MLLTFVVHVIFLMNGSDLKLLPKYLFFFILSNFVIVLSFNKVEMTEGGMFWKDE